MRVQTELLYACENRGVQPRLDVVNAVARVNIAVYQKRRLARRAFNGGGDALGSRNLGRIDGRHMTPS
jgi:hypothetical protein